MQSKQHKVACGLTVLVAISFVVGNLAGRPVLRQKAALVDNSIHWVMYHHGWPFTWMSRSTYIENRGIAESASFFPIDEAATEFLRVDVACINLLIGAMVTLIAFISLKRRKLQISMRRMLMLILLSSLIFLGIGMSTYAAWAYIFLLPFFCGCNLDL